MTIEELIQITVDKKASDLHLTTGIPPTIRIHGKLIHLDYPILNNEHIKELVQQLLNNKSKLMNTFLEKGEVDFSFSMKGIGRFRVNVFRQRDSWAAALRRVGMDIPKMEDLELPRSILEEFCNHAKGLILITGATGSGKSTSLATMIDYINQTRSEHILTLEDPIEYLHKHKMSMVNQREIGADTTSYADGLRAALREDPDVILVGEMRDQETISTAITAAETGHLVFSTLHTIGAVQTIERIIDVFPAHQQQQVRVQLASILRGVVSQQLIPAADGKGRHVALEIMVTTPAISNLIRESKSHQIYSHVQTGAKQGMITMDAALVKLYKTGRINMQTAQHYAQVSDEFKRLMQM